MRVTRSSRANTTSTTASGPAVTLANCGSSAFRRCVNSPEFRCNTDCASGYGFTDGTQEMLEEAVATAGVTTTTRTSRRRDGDYDGEYLYVNDKANGRIARVNLTYFETDAITDVPNVQVIHGCCVHSPDTSTSGQR